MKTEEIQNLERLTDTELLNQTRSLVREERRLGIQILHRLKEISRRRLYSELGFSSLFTYLCQHLSYPESTAYRLVSAMKLLSEIPEAEKKVESGDLSIATLSQVQSYCQAQKKENAFQVKADEKRRILQAVEGCSRKKAEQVLASFHTSNPLPIHRETEKTVAPDQTEIKFVIGNDVLAKLNRIKDLTAHKKFNPTYAELVDLMADVVLDQLDPVRKAAKADLRKKTRENPKRTDDLETKKDENAEIGNPVDQQAEADRKIDREASPSTSPGKQSDCSDPQRPMVESPNQGSEAEAQAHKSDPSEATPRQVPSRYVPAQVRRQAWVQAQGRCTFVSPTTGHRCTETKGLELEHREPWGLGGSHEMDNITLLCKAHNLYTAIRSYGRDKMRKYVLV